MCMYIHTLCMYIHSRTFAKNCYLIFEGFPKLWLNCNCLYTNVALTSRNDPCEDLGGEHSSTFHPGVDVMITIFCDFCQLSAIKLAFFSKTNFMINFFQKLAVSSLSKKRQYFRQLFS
jgi:hypothetical protein